MVEMATKCQWSEVRVNSLRVVSAIGTVLAQSQEVHVLLKVRFSAKIYEKLVFIYFKLTLDTAEWSMITAWFSLKVEDL